MMFAIPRGKVTYFGTTDTFFDEDKDKIGISIVDAMYLISAVNNMFPDIELTIDDIESSWAGLRPLIYEEGKSASELSRKDEIFYSESKLISIAGGKLTGYRKMAQRVVDMVARKLKKRFEQEFDEVATDKTPLTENPFKDSNEVKTYIKTISKRIDSEGLSPVVATYLVHNYGKQTDRILEIFEKIDKKEAPFRLMVAELKYCLTHEMVCTPLDFFIRRTGRMYFDKPSVASSKEIILAAFSSHFKWNQKTAEYHKKQLDITLQNTVEFV